MTVAIPAKKRRRRGRLRQVLSAIQLLILSVVAVGLVFTAVTIWNLSTILPQNGGAIGNIDPIESSNIYSSNGELLATIFMDENREYVPLKKIPIALQRATIAVEDKQFYDHNGVDFRGIARAVVEDVRSQARSQGGSTITQQLVRNVYLTRHKSMGRKIQEALLAVQIERKYSKDEILEKYLNQIFYGSGAYGVQAAAHTYFGKKAWELTLPECALIAGLPQRPTGYSPYKSKKLAKERRNTVLALMAQEGYITQAEKIKAQKTPIKLAYSRPSGARIRRASYFVDYIMDDLVDRYGANTVYKGGLRVYTTLHTGMQAAADKAVKDGVRSLEDSHVSQGALVSIDPRTGYIRAMVGGTDYKRSQLNRAYLSKHPRSPGSSFKPFVYAAAFEKGASPDDTIDDDPISIEDGNRWWEPKNYDNKWYGTITIRTAVAQSRNIPAIKTIQKIGVDSAIETAHRLGIESPLGHNLSLAIGTSGVTMVELVSAYGTFANNGLHADPISITKITDRQGNVIEENKPHVTKVLRSDIVDEVDECLRAVTTEGTGRKVGAAIEDVRGKTGTAQDDRDAWFVGYVPQQLVTAVWVGNDDNSKMRHVFGGTNCGPIWINYMQQALKMNPKVKSLPKPQSEKEAKKDKEEVKKREKRRRRDAPEGQDNWNENRPLDPDVKSASSETVRVRLCSDTGLLATSACPSTYSESFTRGDAPTESCNLHAGRPLDEARTARHVRVRRDAADPPAGAGEENEFTHLRHDAPSPDARNNDATGAAARRSEFDRPRSEFDRGSVPADRRSSRMVRVTLCLESGDLATRNCPDTIQKRLPASEAPTRYCAIHGSGG